MNEVTVAEPRHPLALYEMALNQNVDPAKLEKLLDLAERVDKRNAEKEFAVAMVRAQQRIMSAPPILKNKTNPGTKSKYAEYETIQFAIKPIIIEEGFTPSFSTADSQLENHIRIVCTLFHRGGHSKDYFLDLPVDKSGAMNPVQGHGSTIKYGERYLTCMIFDVPVVGDDNDGAKFATLIGDEQCLYLQELIHETKADFGAFMEWVSQVAKRSITKLDEIPFAIFEKVREKLLEKQRAQAGRKGGQG